MGGSAVRWVSSKDPSDQGIFWNALREHKRIAAFEVCMRLLASEFSGSGDGGGWIPCSSPHWFWGVGRMTGKSVRGKPPVSGKMLSRLIHAIKGATLTGMIKKNCIQAPAQLGFRLFIDTFAFHLNLQVTLGYLHSKNYAIRPLRHILTSASYFSRQSFQKGLYERFIVIYL